MSQSSNLVTINPYFKVHAGKMEAFKALLPAFLERTQTETGNLFYEFTINGDEVFCREGYVGAEGALVHLDNVGPILQQALAIADLTRLEIHGPAAELAKLHAPLAHLSPAWFSFECGLNR